MELLLELLPPLAPRYYSLSSSPLAAEGPSSVGFAFTVVEYATPSGAARAGLATTYLAAIAASMTAGGGGGGSSSSSSLCCFAKPTPSFHLPEDASTPCVLIGPGTGVAPFVGFAQHRLAQGVDDAARGKLELYFGTAENGVSFPPSPSVFLLCVCEQTIGFHIINSSTKICRWLHTGCREEQKDFLYREVLEASVAGGALGRLVTAFSREQAEKVYVQDRLREDGAHVAELVLKEGARLYVCGDGGGMFQGVNAALVRARALLPPRCAALRCAVLHGARPVPSFLLQARG